ncbi:MAG: hypothetical protein ACK559_09160, partial [bacterium]
EARRARDADRHQRILLGDEARELPGLLLHEREARHRERQAPCADSVAQVALHAGVEHVDLEAHGPSGGDEFPRGDAGDGADGERHRCVALARRPRDVAHRAVGGARGRERVAHAGQQAAGAHRCEGRVLGEGLSRHAVAEAHGEALDRLPWVGVGLPRGVACGDEGLPRIGRGVVGEDQVVADLELEDA